MHLGDSGLGTSIYKSANVTTGTTTGNLCCFDSGNYRTIENKLGQTGKLMIVQWGN
jgi:hypothetical protein